MSYTRPGYGTADASWAGSSTYERPTYGTADVTFEEGSPGAVVLVTAHPPPLVETGINYNVSFLAYPPAEILRPPVSPATFVGNLPEVIIAIGWKVLAAANKAAEIELVPVTQVTGFSVPPSEIDYPESVNVSVTYDVPSVWITIGWRVAVVPNKPAEIDLPPGIRIQVTAASYLLGISEHPPGKSIIVRAIVPPVVTTIAPRYFLPSYVFDGTKISFLITDLPLSRTSGVRNTDQDWRKIAQGLMLRVGEYLLTIPYADYHNIWFDNTQNYTYEHDILGNVWHQDVTIQVAREFPDAHIIGQP